LWRSERVRTRCWRDVNCGGLGPGVCMRPHIMPSTGAVVR
jgi:hypothetical protein